MMAHKKCMKRCMTGAMAGKHGKGGKAAKGKMAGKGRCAGMRGCPQQGRGGGLPAGGGLMKLMMGHMALAAPDAAALGPMGPCGRGLPRRWSLSGLDLGPEQRAELRELAYRHLKSLHELQAQRNALRLEAVYLLGAEKLDAQRLEKVYADLGKAQAQLLANSRSYLDGLRSLLSAEQLSGLQP
jgi:Spy/CpxP family protein refolding chaperone